MKDEDKTRRKCKMFRFDYSTALSLLYGTRWTIFFLRTIVSLFNCTKFTYSFDIQRRNIENIDRHIYVQSLKNLPSNNMGTNQKCRALLRKHAGYENGWTRVAKGKLDRRARRFEIGLHESKKVCPAAFLAQCLAVRDKD